MRVVKNSTLGFPYTRAEVIALHGGEHLEAVTVRDVVSGATEEIATRAVRHGGRGAQHDWLSDLVELDAKGFVKTGRDAGVDFGTSRPGIFAVGDVRAGSVKRVASAVGEGSVVVSKAWG